MKALIYIRVSTLEQAKEGYSIGTQKKRLTAYAQSQDWDIYDIYIDDGYSAKDLNRPDMQRMIKDVKENENDELVVLVFKLDRMTRSVLDLYKLLDIFEENKTKFKSATEVYDTTTAMGRLFITLVAALAQWERENLSERVKVNMEEMVLGGNWHGGIVPYGYEWDGKSLYVVPKQAEIVKEIFRMYLRGKSDYAITRHLNAKGYVTTKGAAFAHSTVGYILKNPIYCGDLRWNLSNDADYFTVPDIVEPIIPREMFDMVQKLRESRRKVHPRQANSDYIFSGKLVCNRCGNRLVGQKTKKEKTHYHYYCPKQRRGICDMPYFNELHVEKYVLDYLSYLEDESALNEISSTLDKSATDITSELKQLQRDLKSVKTRKKKWQFAFANDAITIEELRDLTKDDNEHEKMIMERLERITNDDISSLSLDYESIINIIKDINASWDEADRVEKKTMIQILMNDIVIDTPDTLKTRHKRNEMRQVDIINVNFN